MSAPPRLPVNSDTLTSIFVFLGILAGLKIVLEQWLFDKKREKRRTYYRTTYLSSDDWKRKRALVLKRDQYRCMHCGARATQVHHKRYARRNIGKEPIEWLVSVCKSCHEEQHDHKR
jgi:5-methylcytosine-specific restriction endonuclease McrA